MSRRIDWWDVLDVFCWGLETLGNPSISKAFYDYGEAKYHNYVPRLCKRMAAQQLVERNGRGKNVTFTITSKGRDLCRDADPARNWHRSWDLRWRLVTFDIPEDRRKDRVTLWRELRHRRLGLLQRSVWIWPHDIEPVLNEVIKATGIPECFAGFECSRLFLCSNEELVKSAWDFEAIGRQQETFLKQKSSFLTRLRVATSIPLLARVARDERHAYVNAFESDPLLPGELRPKGYSGGAVIDAHRTFRTELSRRFQEMALPKK